MPNFTNISAPINVHGIGRSGTTLLQNILGATGNLQICNETTGLVFAPYRGGELTAGSSDREAAPVNAGAAAVHASLCAVLPSGKSRWCQKLGGIPKFVRWDMIDAADKAYAIEPYPFPYGWYWEVLRNCFPESNDVLILRDYRDVIVSRHRYSGWNRESICADIAIYFNLLAYPAAKIDHLVRYEELISDPAGTVGRLLTALGLSGGSDASCALAWHASPSAGETLAEARGRGFAWERLHSQTITQSMRQIMSPSVRRLEQRLGISLGM